MSARAPLSEFRHAVKLFNRGDFFAAHEVWEDVWRAAPPSEKKFLQGLIQVSVAFHHHSTGNLVGARSLLDRGFGNLESCSQNKSGARDQGNVRLRALLDQLTGWRRAFAEGGSLPPLPRIEWIGR